MDAINGFLPNSASGSVRPFIISSSLLCVRNVLQQIEALPLPRLPVPSFLGEVALLLHGLQRRPRPARAHLPRPLRPFAVVVQVRIHEDGLAREGARLPSDKPFKTPLRELDNWWVLLLNCVFA